NGLAVYKGNYSSYLTQREAAFDREQKLFEAEYERLSKELEFIRRHIAGGKHDMAKGKLRRLTRDIVLIEEVGLTGREGKSWLEIGGRVRTFSPNEAAQRLKGLQPPDNRPPRLNIRLDSNEKSGELVLKTQRLRIGYDSKFLFKTEKIKLERLECAAIIGPNGSGKSTFLKTLLREVPPLKGKIDYGDNLQVGYFAQAHEQLDPEKGVIEELLYRFDIGENQARAHLAQYLFKGHDVFKQVKDLSGGERGRLALAILSLEEANLLLLDEPTNHLDISSQEVLQEVLETYDGTILLVSHDRYLVSRLATQIWEIRDEELFVFDGSYEAYLGEVAVYQSGQTPLDKGGEKLSVRTEDQTTASQAVPDVSWVNELAVDVNPTVEQTLPTRKSDRGRARGHLETYLDKLYEELEIAELAGEEDEVAWLQEEITITEQKLG
ncbi:MAG: ATP-binding cassette domain-containing protein, partial [Chloroflexota bacterium]